jgi:hypothetical protein
MEEKQKGLLIRKNTTFTMTDKKRFNSSKNIWQAIGFENYLSGDSPE